MNRIFKQLFALLLMVFTVSASFTAVGGTQQDIAKSSVIESIKKRGYMKVGLSLFVPWSMRDKKGELIGFEIDVANKLATDMGVEAEFVPVSWDGIIPALVSGKFDVIISGMSITPERNLTVNFSDPYSYSGLKIIANKVMTQGFSIEDFNNENVTFSARRGATTANTIQVLFPKAKLLQFDEEAATLQEVLNGKAHATMGSEPFPSTEVAKNPETLVIPTDTVFSKAAEAFALRKGDPDALNFFNNWIAANHRNGFLKERHDYWFTTTDWAGQVE
ncbi:MULTISPECIES: transporter substrate-binding domain-containing protein [Grimontia]|uniref:Cystine-binding periplasmic protein n=1 Tax=Grimontia marina TaxID=646534 RepID=A0A128FD36_9GAMM|nr:MULTISPECIES: transporter substrate-binding domain-containing protein [Grimontia]WRV99108.1 transporter substrate-binding domain-containing protein [Grimontia sp. NTOU-MAR1]CZF84658.1 Cystine-binding periplasmic protein precursor [Grimontia marina]